MKKKNEKKRSFNRVMNVIIGLLVIVFAGSVILLSKEIQEYQMGNKTYDKIKSEVKKDESKATAEKEPYINIDFDKLSDINSDIVGWLYCEDTRIDYPVVQTDNNEYYLHHLINGKVNSAGTLFVSCNNASDLDDDNTIIYGHNMRNDSMFGTLEEFVEQSFYNDHSVMYYITPELTYEIDLIGGYVTSENSEAYTEKFASSQDWNKYIDQIYSDSLFNSSYKKSKIKKIVTLSTCAYDYEGARCVLQGAVSVVE